MSGGDGKDSRGPTGGVKGGPTGIGGGGKGSGSGNIPAIGSGKGNFKIASQRHEGGWVNSYNAAGQLIGAARESGHGTVNGRNVNDGRGQNGGWAGDGPVKANLINATIEEAIKKGLPQGNVAATSTTVYKAMRENFDSLPLDKQPTARDQIIQAWQKSHAAMPDKIRKEYQRGGRNGNSQFRNVDNQAKKKLGESIHQVTDDINQALEQHQKAKAEADAKAKNEEETRQREKEQNEKEALTKASELISDVGEKISAHLGGKYRDVAKKIADDIKNFQGKTIRSHEDAMKSLNKITSNPNMKINKADKDAIINAWKNINAQDMANKLGNLGKAFKVADVVQKIEKVREKSIEGYETGNWDPLMLEVESWVLSGIAASVALGIFSATLGAALLAAGVPAVTVGIMGIIVAGTVAALIDDKLVDFINNEVIRPAH